MFEIGDLIIYGSEGVCRVENIGIPDMFDIDKEHPYYTLRPLYRQGKIYTPVNSSVFMRPVISRQEALDLIQSYPDIDDTIIENRNIRVLSEKYQQTINTHDCSDLLRILKSVHHKKRILDQRGKKLGQVDEKYFKKAEDLLHGEFAVALDIPKEEVSNFIKSRVQELNESLN